MRSCVADRAFLGERVRLYEMRPIRRTPAHQTDRLAEIVCSNSLKSDQPLQRVVALKGRTAQAGLDSHPDRGFGSRAGGSGAGGRS